MTLMQLVRLVLDEAYADIAGTEAVKDAAIKQEMDRLSAAYTDLLNPHRVAIDYASPLARFAYIYKYTVAHADYVQQLINSSADLSKLFQANATSVACLGGGPGSDLLGMLKYMLTAGSKTTLTCYLFDKERAWGDSWSEVAKPLKAAFPLYPVFQQLDVTDVATWQSYRKFLSADLFTLSYFLSEVHSFGARAAPFFQYCFTNAKSGTLILFVDNDDRDGIFAGWFDHMAGLSNIDILSKSCCEMSFDLEEEKRDLEPYYSKFGWPKRKSRLAYRIARKR